MMPEIIHISQLAAAEERERYLQHTARNWKPRQQSRYSLGEETMPAAWLTAYPMVRTIRTKIHLMA